MSRPRGLLTTVVVVLALVGAACGSDDEPTLAGEGTTTTVSGDMGDMGDTGDADHGMFSFGEAADAADADRVVEIEQKDELRFTPDEIAVAVGETVTFRVHNAGAIPHDFTIGDAATQDTHDAEMAEMTDMGDEMEHGEGNAMTVEPGETNELTWHFTEVDGVLFGCHIPGHYAAGMRGTFVEAG